MLPLVPRTDLIYPTNQKRKVTRHLEWSSELLELEPRLLFSASPIDPVGVDGLDAFANSPSQFEMDDDGLGVTDGLDWNPTPKFLTLPFLHSVDSRSETAENDGSVWQSVNETDDVSEADVFDETIESNSVAPLAQIVFIDSGVAGWQELWDDLAARDDKSQIEVVVLDRHRDGIDQISDYLEGRHQIGAVHLVSHGNREQLVVGQTTLTDDSVSNYSGQLIAWRESLADGADLLIYGCDLGGSESGQSLLSKLAVLCDCDVAASDDTTGHASLEGNWRLEFQHGQITTDAIFSESLKDNWFHELAVFSVTSTSGTQAVGTLAWAVDQANLDAAHDTIEFNLSGGGIYRINLANPLVLSTSMTLDASTQPGFAIGAPVVELDAAGMSSGSAAIAILGDGVEVRGFSIVNAGGSGIEIYGDSAVVAGNWVGIGAAGTIGANEVGISVFGDNSIVGGTTPSDRNVVAGNHRQGILVGSDAFANVVVGNHIGTDFVGTASLGNGREGILLEASAAFNAIGGLQANEGNLITNNTDEGIRQTSPGIGNSFRGNSIFDNGRLEIDLGSRGVNPNDLTSPIADHDNGANRLQNYPVIASAIYDGMNLSIAGDVSGRDFVDYEVDFYASSSVDPSGFGGGERYLGTVVVPTDSDGQVAFSVSIEASLNPGEYLTATTVHTDGSTSEFSQAFSILLANRAPVLDSSADLSMLIGVDDFSNQGLTIADWLAVSGTDPITDADGDPEGIAIVGLDDSNGRWEALVENETDWVPLNLVDVIDSNNAILLNAASRLRFVPNPGFVGNSGAIDFRAWDQSDGIINSAIFIDTEPQGGSSAYSTNIEQLVVRVGDVIDSQPDVYTTSENTDLSGVNVLGNDVFTGTVARTLSVASFDATSSLGANVTVLSDGSLTYSQGSLFDDLGSGDSAIDTFRYTVTDGNGYFESVQVSVQIEGTNDRPQMAAQTFHVDETADDGVVVGTVIATDVDQAASGMLSFSIVGGTGLGVFSISSSGQIEVFDASTLDFESTTSYTIDVRVVDQDASPLSRTRTMTIDVNNVNETPSLSIDNAVTSLSEDHDTSSRTKVADLSVIDDSLGVNDLFLTGADAGMFEIIGNELYLRADSDLDFETKPQLDVTVVVDDAGVGGSPDATSDFVLNVTDVIETVPAIVLTSGATLETNESGTTTVFQVALSTPPASLVTVNLVSDNTTEGIPLTVSLTFSASDWNVPQVVEVEGQSDFIVDGDVRFRVLLSASSLDPNFDQLNESVEVVNVDRTAFIAPVAATIDSTSSDESSNESEEGDAESLASAPPSRGGSNAVVSAASSARSKAAIEIVDQGSSQQDDSSNEPYRVSVTSSSSYPSSAKRIVTSQEQLVSGQYSYEAVDSTQPMSQAFYDDMDDLRELMQTQASLPRVVVGSVATMASALTVGYVTWLIRGGQILVGVLGHMPVWRFVDPLPILSSLAIDEEEDESLANMVDKHQGEAEGRSQSFPNTDSDSFKKIRLDRPAASQPISWANESSAIGSEPSQLPSQLPNQLSSKLAPQGAQR